MTGRSSTVLALVARRSFAALLALALAGGCARGTPQSAAPASSSVSAVVYPGRSWERIGSPEQAGFSSARLAEVARRADSLGTTGMMVIVGGRVLMEHGDVQEISYLASVRKSILSMLYGNYVANGTVRLDKTLAEMGIDDRLGLTDAEKQATIEDLLSARSGIYHPASNSGDDLASAPPRGSQPHGTYMLYSNWDFNAVGTIFAQETGRAIYDALETDLARPIGMQDFDRDRHRLSGDTTRSRHLAYHIHLSTRDMARIGYLMLREGSWNGRQLVPREWVKRSTRAITPVAEMNPERRRADRFGYGYLWWVWDGPAATGAFEGAYSGIGAGGQYITVIPKLDMVVAHKTNFQRTRRQIRHPSYFEMVDMIVAAKCVSRCPEPRDQPPNWNR